MYPGTGKREFPRISLQTGGGHDEFSHGTGQLWPHRSGRQSAVGDQTQRALENFAIGDQPMPREIIRALALVKKTAAKVNAGLGLLDGKLLAAIAEAAEEIAAGRLDDHFPLNVWQTGSGTQSHMNVNEVIANRANRNPRRQARREGAGPSQRPCQPGPVLQ